MSAPPLPPIYRWDVAGPRGLVHIVHGMSEHGGRYARIAKALNAVGYSVWAHDHRGHGRNLTPPVGLGHFADAEGWRAIVDDAWDVSNALRNTHPTLPLILFGHSMGSFVAQTLIGEYGPAYGAAVLSGSNGPAGVLELVGRLIAFAQLRLLGGRARGMWMHRLVMGTYNRQFAPTRTRADWLSRDMREVDLYVADALCGTPLTSRSWSDFLAGKAVLGTREHLRRVPKNLPILLISGSRDPVGENGRGVRRLLAAYHRAGLTRVSIKLYDDARHELVNEINRDAVTADLVEWLDEATASAALDRARPDTLAPLPVSAP